MKAAKDLVEAKELYHDILKFGDEGVIEGFPDDITATIFLLNAKVESRFNKGRPFNAFMLHQKSVEENELIQFLEIIKESLNKFTEKTRLHLAILTSYLDKDTQEYIEKNKIKTPEEIRHWTSVDIFIDNGKIKTFVLDAANAINLVGIKNLFKTTFPHGEHYSFQMDSIRHPKDPSREKFRTIQSDDENCRTFTLEHLRQLSQIDSTQLYAELKQISTEDGRLLPKNLVYGLSLNRVFRATQSWVTLNSLPAVLSTVLKGNDTLFDFAEKHSELKYGTKQNIAILNKKYKHFQTEVDYYNKLTNDMSTLILEHRKGSAFIKNPILFQLKDILSEMSSDDPTVFIQLLCKNIRELISEISVAPCKEINNFLIKLTNLLFCENLSSAKNEILLRLSSLFNSMEANDNFDMAHLLHNSLKKSMDKLKINYLVREFSTDVNSIAENKLTSYSKKKILISEKTIIIKKEISEKFPKNEYILAKHKIREIKKLCYFKMEKLRITPVEELINSDFTLFKTHSPKSTTKPSGSSDDSLSDTRANALA